MKPTLGEVRLFLTDVEELVIVRDGMDGFYVVSCPDVPGCHSQGETIKEAIANIKDAIEACKATPYVSSSSSSSSAPRPFTEAEGVGSRHVIWGCSAGVWAVGK